MKRVLCLISGMNAGGAETFLMKLYRQLDKTRYQMDFCINTPEKCFYEDEIVSLGGKIFRIPSKSQDRKAFAKQLTKVVRDNRYEHVLRITSSAEGFMDLKIAKKAGAKVCAARSSNSQDAGGWKAKLIHRAGRALYGRYVDVKIAPSDLAAIHTFGAGAYKAGQVAILHNAVDLDVFRYDAQGAARVRKEWNIPENALLVGHVGRFMVQKNHGFVLEIFAQILKKNPNSSLLLVGTGNLEQQVRERAEALGIGEHVIFAGLRSDVPQLLSAMDVFVFPSLYEGMPNTVIEAQATGLSCVISDTITREADITGLVEYLPLNLSAQQWAQKALERAGLERRDTHGDFVANRYDIESITREFVKLIFEGKCL